MIHLLNETAFTAFGEPVSNAELLGFVSGALCVWLVVRQHVWSWPVGIANNLVWIVLFVSAGLFADSALQVVYVVLGLWGWWCWTHRAGSRVDDVPVGTTSPRAWAALAVAGIAGTAFLTWFLDVATTSTVPFFDAVTTALSLLATWGQAQKKVESWWLWMAADVIYVPMYLQKDLVLTALLNVGFFALCVRGLLAWRRELTATTAPAGREIALVLP